MPYIYKIFNDINDKLYIGKTLYTIERRWKQHKNNALNRKDLEHLPLYAAINKHGIEHFSIEEIEKVTDEKKLSEREQYWIKYYNTYSYGYNASIGGDGLQLYDYDYIWELWEQGNTIKQISALIHCNDYVVRTVLNIHNVSTEERKSRSAYRQNEGHRPYRRKVNQIDISTNEITHTYDSVCEAAASIPCDNSYLSKLCNDKKIAFGYKWEYQDNNYVKKDFTAKPVCKLDLKTGKILEIYPSGAIAAKAVGGDSSYISKVCRGIQKSSKGFGWKFLEDKP